MCFCCRHSPVQDMNVRIFGVRAMECMYPQTRPRLILSSERVLGEWSQNPCIPQVENPLYRKNSPQRRMEPRPLHQAGQRVQHTAHELFRPLLMELEPMLTPREDIPSTENILPRGGSNPRRCIKQDSEPNITTN